MDPSNKDSVVAAVPAAETESPAPHLAPVLGGIEITVTKRTGAFEKVKVLQLPIRILTTEWPNLLSDEAGLVELYCDKIDRERRAKLLKLSGETLGLMQLMQKCSDRDELEKISGELSMTRAEIEKLNSQSRWDDELLPDSHDEIVQIGYQLNRPRFDRWLANRQNAIGHLKDTYRLYLPEHPLVANQPAPETASPARTPDGGGSAASSPTSPPSPAEATQK